VCDCDNDNDDDDNGGDDGSLHVHHIGGMRMHRSQYTEWSRYQDAYQVHPCVYYYYYYYYYYYHSLRERSSERTVARSYVNLYVTG
jgi:hypothetical protein